MKKLFLCGLIAASLGITAAQAAGSAQQNFTVSASLTPKCVTSYTAATTPVLSFGTYTAFGSAATGSTSITFQCTHNVSISSATLDATSGNVAGLGYTVSVGTATSSLGSGASGGTGATADSYTYPISGNIAAGQAGDATAGTTDTRTLTIAF